jgi:hypothetical protein
MFSPSRNLAFIEMNDLETFNQQGMETKYDDVTTTNGYIQRIRKHMMTHGMCRKTRVLF